MATPRVLQSMSHEEVGIALFRHASGDWGELSAEDIALNERGLAEGTRLLSAFTSKDGLKFWIITEADRSSTTVLIPDDY